MNKVRVWDLPTRSFHWLLAGLVVTAYVSGGEDEGLTYQLHVASGYGVMILILFRVVWGFLGTTYARFGTFTPRPSAVAQYVGGVMRGNPPHFLGHNPLGALNIYLMLGLLVAVVVTGLAMFSGGEEELHEVLANLVMILVCLHLAGVVLDSLMTEENLTLAMLTGRKHRPSSEETSGDETADVRVQPARFAAAAAATAVLVVGLAAVTPFLSWPPPDVEDGEHEHHEHGEDHYYEGYDDD